MLFLDQLMEIVGVILKQEPQLTKLLVIKNLAQPQ